MCLAPVKIYDRGWVACRECWQCRERKVDDWVGRNIAESKTAKAAHVVTLTYGRDKSTGGIDHLRAAVLTYSDVQKMLKHLRVDGYPVRYFVVGEYGSLKNRAHWHIIFYWQGRVPVFNLRDEFYSWPYWKHGFSYWDKMGAGAVRYACKYLLKDPADDAAQSFGPMPSKKPPLGDAYFRQLARQHVEQGLSPQHLFYSFPEVKRIPRGAQGKTVQVLRDWAAPVQFLMKNKTAENFCKYFVDEWRAVHNDDPPRSPVIWAYLDKQLADYLDSVQQPRFDRRGYVPEPFDRPLGGEMPVFDEVANCYYSLVGDEKLWWSYNSEGDLQWHEKIRPDLSRLPYLNPEEYRQQSGR